MSIPETTICRCPDPGPWYHSADYKERMCGRCNAPRMNDVDTRFCVDCRKRCLPPTSRDVRCPPCKVAFDARGGITKTTAAIVTHRGGMKTGGQTIFHGYARYCTNCGGRLGEASYAGRVSYALKLGGECHTCDGCYSRKRWGPPRK